MTGNNPKYGTLRHLDDIAQAYGCRVKKHGARKCLQIVKNGESRTIIDFKLNQVPGGVRDRSFEQWGEIIKENADSFAL